MSLALDAAYAITAAVTAPWWMRKARGGWPERFGRIDPIPRDGRRRLLLHAVSVGEVNLTRPLVELLRHEFDVVLSVTTDTGIARARALFESGPGAGTVRVVRYPLDASWSVRRFLDAVRPDAVALVELELWPNFLRACQARQIPVAVINGRLSARSFKRYHAARRFIGGAFRELAFAAVQDDVYAERFRRMGTPEDRIIVAGSMKWDAAETSMSVAGADALAEEMGIDRSRALVVAGSTAPGEHELLHEAMRQAAPGAQLLCAPRRPEWFDQAAEALPGCVRRSSGVRGPSDRYLLDTIGELRKAYALADVIVVGRSFGSLYGSDPMEPAALGKPVVIGTSVADFESIVRTMRQSDAILQVDASALSGELKRLLESPQARAELGERARACVIANQGAAAHHATLLHERLLRATEARS